VSYVYCPECGFQNQETANYCAKCGALLVKDEGGTETTQTFSPDELADDTSAGIVDVATEGPALVVRSGGGRAGEHFLAQGEQTTIGRSPDCEIFLDDVTVSRRHALLVQTEDGGFAIEDLGSLNGTFVNRRRIEDSTRLQNGDEVQIGKYRLSFITK
jgi:pSer/pThr/pTyr-binding forkhead associated (FHA) protein